MLNTRRLQRSALLIGGGFFIVAASAPARHEAARLHVHLVKSDPAPNDTLLTSPRALRFWFSEDIELPVTIVKLANDAGTAAPLAPLTRRDGVPSAPIVAPVAKPVAPGKYVVRWSTTSRDGHPAKGSFSFFVKAAL